MWCIQKVEYLFGSLVCIAGEQWNNFFIFQQAQIVNTVLWFCIIFWMEEIEVSRNELWVEWDAFWGIVFSLIWKSLAFLWGCDLGGKLSVGIILHWIEAGSCPCFQISSSSFWPILSRSTNLTRDWLLPCLSQMSCWLSVLPQHSELERKSHGTL